MIPITELIEYLQTFPDSYKIDIEGKVYVVEKKTDTTIQVEKVLTNKFFGYEND